MTEEKSCHTQLLGGRYSTYDPVVKSVPCHLRLQGPPRAAFVSRTLRDKRVTWGNGKPMFAACTKADIDLGSIALPVGILSWGAFCCELTKMRSVTAIRQIGGNAVLGMGGMD